jgi:transposase
MTGKVLPGMQAITLAERRADAQGLDQAMKAHRKTCPECQPRGYQCDAHAEMAAELRQIRAEIRSWFEPDQDQPSLFGTDAVL